MLGFLKLLGDRLSSLNLYVIAAFLILADLLDMLNIYKSPVPVSLHEVA